MSDKESSATGIVQEIAKTLAMIQHLRSAAWSYSRIAVHLNESGIPSLTRWKGQLAPVAWEECQALYRDSFPRPEGIA